MNKTIPAALSILTLLATGCRHKEFEDDSIAMQRIVVEYDWEEAPDANPKGMCVYFYNSETGGHRRFDFRGMEGGEISIPRGTWHIITFNNDMEGVQFRDYDSFHLHTAFTREGNVLEEALGNNLPPSPAGGTIPEAPRVKGAEDESVVITPDMMWGQARQGVLIHPAPGEEVTTITLRPHEMVCTYTYEILHVENLEHVTNMCGAISGMAGELLLIDGTLPRKRNTLPIPAWKADATTIAGKFYTFGHHESNGAEHRMTLYVWMDDGRKLAYGTEGLEKWNVTRQIDEAPDRRHVHYVIDGLDLPVVMQEGGMMPSADDWESEHHEIEV